MNHLPESIKNISAIIGHDATMQLIKTSGGLRILIPINQSGGAAWESLVASIGDEAAKKLQASHKGENIYIPRCQKALTAARWAEIHKDYDEGKNVAELARQHALSYRQIENILKKPTERVPEGSPEQGLLFG